MTIRHLLIAALLICPSLSWAESGCREVTDVVGRSVRFCKSYTGHWLVDPSRYAQRLAVRACPDPQPIPVPDGNTANVHELAIALDRIKTYRAATDAFGECLRVQRKLAGLGREWDRLVEAQRVADAHVATTERLILKELDVQRDRNQPPTTFREGVHFMTIPVPQSYDSELILFGSLACSDCYAERKNVEEFRKARPTIKITFVPVTWGFDKERNLDYDAYARAELIAGMLGGAWLQQIGDRLKTFRQILRTDSDVRQLFLGLGCDAQQFDNVASSFALRAQIQRAQDQTRRFRVDGAPTYVVKGRYLVPTWIYDSKGNQHLHGEKLIKIVEHLLEKS